MSLLIFKHTDWRFYLGAQSIINPIYRKRLRCQRERPLTYKQLETHRGILSTVATDGRPGSWAQPRAWDCHRGRPGSWAQLRAWDCHRGRPGSWAQPRAWGFFSSWSSVYAASKLDACVFLASCEIVLLASEKKNHTSKSNLQTNLYFNFLVLYKLAKIQIYKFALTWLKITVASLVNGSQMLFHYVCLTTLRVHSNLTDFDYEGITIEARRNRQNRVCFQ